MKSVNNSGLKRSMPCVDLIAMDSNVANEKFFMEAYRLLDDASSFWNASSEPRKRQRLSSSLCMFADSKVSQALCGQSDCIDDSPATAALEEALAIDDMEEHALELELLGSCLFSSCAADFARIEYNNSVQHPLSSCSQRKQSFPVHSTVLDVSRLMARMTTSSSA